MRRIAITLVLCAFAVYISAQPNQATEKKDRSAEPKPTTEHQDISANTPNETKTNPPQWYAALKRPDWWLVIVAALTGLAIVYQANESAKATEAMRESIKLQETAMRQWIGTKKWSMEFQMDEQGLGSCKIMFYVVNPTKLPLTFKSLSLVMAGKQFDRGSKAFLVPDERYPITFTVKLNEAQTTELTTDRIRFNFTGLIFYRDTFGRDRAQAFGNTCVFTPTNGVFIPYQGDLPQPPEEEN